MTRGALSAVAFLAAAACAAPACAERAAFFEEGRASWYGNEFHGRRTASGEVFDQDGVTAAHRTLPFGTLLLVTNVDNGRAATLRVNDRGPFVAGRVLDCSRGAADALGFRLAGIAEVRLEILGELPAADDPRLTKSQRKRLGKAVRRASRRGREVEVARQHPELLLPVDPEAGAFAVQVGAFARHENADALAAKLRAEGRPAESAWVRDDGLKRVRVGPFADRRAAELAAEALRAEGHPTFVVRAD